jgi:hypothetical protein
MPDKKCPISCGRCCGNCDDLGPDGCQLPRERRPPHCRSFICEVSNAVSVGAIDRDEAFAELRLRWGF